MEEMNISFGEADMKLVISLSTITVPPSKVVPKVIPQMGFPV